MMMIEVHLSDEKCDGRTRAMEDERVLLQKLTVPQPASHSQEPFLSH